MGVLPCYRDECRNIMCARYSRKYGYICSECFKELCDSGFDTDIEEFMESEKNKNDLKVAIARYNIEFPIT